MSAPSEQEPNADPHQSPPASAAKRLMWRVEHLGHALLGALIGRLPVAWAHRLGESIAGALWRVMPRRRRTVLANLRIAFGEDHPMEQLEEMARLSFRRVGGNLLSAACTARMRPGQLAEVLEVENPELVEEAVAHGKGVVLILAHMGNWELLSRMIHFLPEGTKAGAVYRKLNNPIMDREVLARREADGTRMFSKRDQFHQISGFVRSGGVLGVLADQRVGHGGELTPYFGRLTRVSPIPRMLARRTGCRVLALALIGDRPGHWRARYLPVEEPLDTAHCTAALEQAILASPLDVFWLQRRWKCHIKNDVTLQTWLSAKTGRSGRPHRILLWLGLVPAGWQLPPEWVHDDVDYELALPAGVAPPAGLPPIVRTHQIPATGDLARLGQFLHDIDRAEVRPLDAVLSLHGPWKLRRLAKELAFDHAELGAAFSPSA